MQQVQEMLGIPTKQKAKQIARRERLLCPQCSVQIISNGCIFSKSQGKNIFL